MTGFEPGSFVSIVTTLSNVLQTPTQRVYWVKGSGCGSVGRAVDSGIRRSTVQMQPSAEILQCCSQYQRQVLFQSFVNNIKHVFYINCSEKKKIKEKRGRNWSIFPITNKTFLPKMLFFPFKSISGSFI